MSLAFVFPGQGAQTIGMGRDLAEAYPAARAVFDEVDEALGEKLSALIWEGDQAELTLTENAQPALMATSMAVVRALEAEGVAMDGVSYVAGHSLGEYSALCAAGMFTVADAARLLRRRGQAMQAAVPVGEGAMAAILGLDIDAVTALAAGAAEGEVCTAANDNDPAQVVVSGHKAAVERAAAVAKERGAKRALMLPVSAPFHSRLMAPAADVMAEALAEVEVAAPKVPIVANVLA
nr:ACP S-malonyltransferase [Paracoccaceae bacterium]